MFSILFQDETIQFTAGLYVLTFLIGLCCVFA